MTTGTKFSCSRMFPSLHQDVASAVSEHIKTLRYHKENTGEGVSQEHSTFIMGIFRCYNSTCSTNAWKSGKVTILIRSYWDGSYNAEVFKQRCEACNKLGTLKMDQQSYVTRVADRLLIWSGVAVELPNFGPKKSQPHKTHLCEGCKKGICREASI
jgi:hypothetical protein